MNIWIVSFIAYGLLAAAGTLMSYIIGLAKCNKHSFSASTMEGFQWAALPTLILILTNVSPYFLSIYSEPMKWTDSTMTQASADMLGTGLVMILAIIAMTTRMIHRTEIAVCKPSTAELKKFQTDLMKELHDKEAAKAKEDADAKKDHP